MKNSIVMNVLVGLLLLSAPLAFQVPADGADVTVAGSSPQFGPTIRGCQLGVTIEDAVFVPGEEIVATVVLHNTTSEPIAVLTGGDIPADYDISFTDAAGKEPPLTPLGTEWRKARQFLAGSVRVRYLEPGEEIRRSFRLSDMYDLRSAAAYVLRISERSTHPGNDPTGEAKVLESAPVQVNIGPLPTSAVAVRFGLPVEGFQLGLASRKVYYTPGDKITATIVLRNTTDRRLSLGMHLLPLVDYDVSLRDAGGKEPPMTARGVSQLRSSWIARSGDVHVQTLKPGEEIRIPLPLGELYEIPASGVYTLRVSRSDIPAQEGPAMAKKLDSLPLDLTIGSADRTSAGAKSNGGTQD